MEKVYSRTKGIERDMVSGFCPGCMHGTIFKLIGEVLEEMGLLERRLRSRGWDAAVWQWNMSLMTVRLPRMGGPARWRRE